MMIVPAERLYLTRDKLRIVAAGPDAATLLCGKGRPIPDKYMQLVKEYLSGKIKPKATPEEILAVDKDQPPITTTGPPDETPFEDRETRIPQQFRRRGRPRNPQPKTG